MKIRYTYLIFALVLFSCDVFKEKEEHLFVYEFENNVTSKNITETMEVLKKRLDMYGVNSEIEKYSRNSISVKIKTHHLNNERVNKLLLNQGKLEFWELYNGDSFRSFLEEVNDEFIVNNESDSLKVKPLFNMITSNRYEDVPILCLSRTEDTTAVNLLLKRSDVRSYLPSELKNIKFLWGRPDNKGYYPLYAAKSNKNNKPPLTGEFTTKTIQLHDSNGDASSVLMKMNEEGALRWERITANSYRDYSYIAETLNNKVCDVLIASNGPLRRGEAVVGGILLWKSLKI